MSESGTRGQPVHPSSESNVWEDLVLAMLSVGGYRLDKVLAIRGELDRAGLFDPRNLAARDEARVTRELTLAGYTRGLLTGMYAERLVAAFRRLADAHVAETQAILEAGECDKVRDLLLPHYGIGPKVVENFLTLQRRRRANQLAEKG